jgi:hypothetical protein
MIGYGVFLVAGALTAISISGWDRSKTALFSSGGAASLMIGAAFLASRGSEKTRNLGQLAGTFLPLLFAATFFWRLTINWSKPLEATWIANNPGLTLETSKIQSPLQNWLFPTFIAGSVITFVVIFIESRQKLK